MVIAIGITQQDHSIRLDYAWANDFNQVKQKYTEITDCGNRDYEQADWLIQRQNLEPTGRVYNLKQPMVLMYGNAQVTKIRKLVEVRPIE